MGIWDWAVAAYARPGVAEACLRLQDEFGQNVSLLLWAWRARAADAAVIARAVAVARAWDETTLRPLRAVRQALKPSSPPVADAAREALRDEVKAAELHAERVLLETLGQLGRTAVGAPSGLAALEAVAHAWRPAPPPAALASLAAALE
jgi:uncharacterized protein (TIGR02444 family)